jgi:arylsulfatase A-like enzyme
MKLHYRLLWIALCWNCFFLYSPLAANEAERPNILFCIADDASFPHMGAYGCDWVETPAFDRVAGEGILFTRAYTPNAKCSPSRACILTGRNSWQLEEACNHVPYFPKKFKVYTEVLSESGYFVGKTGKGWAPGVAVDAEGKPRRLAGKSFDTEHAKPPTGAISGNDYSGNFNAFLEANSENRPWCFWYGGFEPHRRYEYGSGASKGGKTLEDLDGKVPPFWPDTDVVRNDMLDYAFEIEHFDQHLERMLDQLEQRGELENTLVVVTADNGMPFPRIKGQEYELSNHLPLAIMWKARLKNPGRVVNDYVSFIDFAPTFLEIAGVDWNQSGMAPTTGRSLTDILFSTQEGLVDPARDHVLIGKERHDVGRPNDWGYPIRGIVKEDLLYLTNFKPQRWPAGNPETGYLNTDGSPTKTEILERRTHPEDRKFWFWNFGKRPPEEMYHVQEDPMCMRNLAQRPSWRSKKQALREQMIEELKDQKDPRVLGEGDIFDEYTYAHESGRSFYERYSEGEKMRAGWVKPTDFEEGPLGEPWSEIPTPRQR